MFTLPKLEYDYDALEPYIDAKTMEIHHSKHHNAYVTKLNKAIVDNGIDENLSLEELFAQMDSYPAAVRNNGGGHYNHSLLWTSLSKQTSQPGEELAQAINDTFGGMDGFHGEFTAAAMDIFGSGWAWLVVDGDKKLKIVHTPNQDNPLMNTTPAEKQGTPLLGIDMWEHAYYLKHQNDKGEWIKDFLQIIDWQKISERYAEAMK